MTVVFNFGYQKIERPDLLVPVIQRDSRNPILIAYAYKNLGQTRELMGLGWEFKRLSRSGDETTTAALKNSPLFLLAHQKLNYRQFSDRTQKHASTATTTIRFVDC